MNIIHEDKAFNFFIINSDYIRKNSEEIKKECYIFHRKYKHFFPDTDSTANYPMYNLFNLTAGSLHFYNIYLEVVEIVKMYGKTKPMWMQSWLNFHKQNEVLKWHNHEWDFHGYISIEPKNSETEFTDYTIKNEVGNIYIGPGMRRHRVNILENFNDERITIGFDVTQMPRLYHCMSLVPVI